jgi:hypothetical protein
MKLMILFIFCGNSLAKYTKGTVFVVNFHWQQFGKTIYAFYNMLIILKLYILILALIYLKFLVR